QSMYSLKRDHSWLIHPDIAYRLYHGRALVGDAVKAVYPGQCEVDWSSPQAPYHGVMIWAKPKRILINPQPVITHQGERTELLVMTLPGVALHEASHAVHTSPRWWTTLRQRHRRFERRAGYTLPENLLFICANLAEDIWIERRLAAEFPGFT